MTSRMAARGVIAAGLAVCALASTARAQELQPSDRTDALRVFLDCDPCDANYLRTEITFINYVRDRKDADLHILVTTEGTGGGGRTYTMKFIGLGRFKGVDQTLTYTSPQTNTSDETRRELASTLKLGLVRYVADTPLASRLRVEYEAPEGLLQPGSVRDPWDFWIFRVSVGGGLNGARSDKSSSIRGSLSANRTTEDWKINLNANGSYRENRFDLDEEGTFTSVSRSMETNALVARSLTQHWSVGAVSTTSSSTFLNLRVRSRNGPGIEYSFFPYSQSTRRLLTLFYTLGYHYFDYREETIFSKQKEHLLDQRVEASLSLRQPWGNASASAEFAQYVTESDKYRISGSGSLEIRLLRGLSLDVDGDVSRRRDQIYLAKGGATAEEILVRQKELATGYQYSVSFGISYSFGSIYNNVVNPRFRNGSGF